MVNTMKVKAIIVDLDRTLLHTDKTISSYTAMILNKCKKSGIGIMAATARPLRTTIQYCELIDFDAMIVSNGARIIWGDHREEHGICKKSAEQLLNTIKHVSSLRITVETGDRAYSNKPIEDYETIICEDLASVAMEEGALKILVSIEDQKTLEMVSKGLTEDLYYTVANGHLMQIMDRSATKWNGIKTMLKNCGYSENEVVYFGDDHDDVEPIKNCGIGIAVSNAIGEVKAVADYVVKSNDEDGVARFIEDVLLHD